MENVKALGKWLKDKIVSSCGEHQTGVEGVIGQAMLPGKKGM